MRSGAPRVSDMRSCTGSNTAPASTAALRWCSTPAHSARARTVSISAKAWPWSASTSRRTCHRHPDTGGPCRLSLRRHELLEHGFAHEIRRQESLVQHEVVEALLTEPR